LDLVQINKIIKIHYYKKKKNLKKKKKKKTLNSESKLVEKLSKNYASLFCTSRRISKLVSFL